MALSLDYSVEFILTNSTFLDYKRKARCGFNMDVILHQSGIKSLNWTPIISVGGSV